MEERDLHQYENNLKVTLVISRVRRTVEVHSSKLYSFGENAIFQVRALFFNYQDSAENKKCISFLSIRYKGNVTSNDMKYVINLTSNALGIRNATFMNNDLWQNICETLRDCTTLFVDIHVTFKVIPEQSPFKSLHDDNELVDFELRAEDGSVRVHKAVLAASSPVLRRMLGGTWRETKDGLIDLPGISKTTLQHYKDYLYLRILPNSGCEQLLLLASYYMIPVLEQQCIERLVEDLKTENTYDLLEFAVNNKATKLVLAILASVQSCDVDVTKIKNHLEKIIVDDNDSNDARKGDDNA